MCAAVDSAPIFAPERRRNFPDRARRAVVTRRWRQSSAGIHAATGDSRVCDVARTIRTFANRIVRATRADACFAVAHAAAPSASWRNWDMASAPFGGSLTNNAASRRRATTGPQCNARLRSAARSRDAAVRVVAGLGAVGFAELDGDDRAVLIASAARAHAEDVVRATLAAGATLTGPERRRLRAALPETDASAAVALALGDGALWRDRMRGYAPDDQASEAAIAARRDMCSYFPPAVARRVIVRILALGARRMRCPAMGAKSGATPYPGA